MALKKEKVFFETGVPGCLVLLLSFLWRLLYQRARTVFLRSQASPVFQELKVPLDEI